ncbi:MAG: DUF418 domain-containing protein, partial [Phycisphaerales bacterium]|nr:DUF418 domain-containing protein [Phycisphaerales bacterium]
MTTPTADPSGLPRPIPPVLITPTPAPYAPPVPPSSRGPVNEADRLKSLDVTRAIALLGIFFVNAELFGMPFSKMVAHAAPTHEGTLSVIVHEFTSIFCAGKFYPLFSLLFGVGLAIMFQSAANAGRSFGWAAARRLIALACFGVLHVLLIWTGDILLIYAFIGVLMVWLARCKPLTLMILSGVALLIGVTLSSLFGLLGPIMESEFANFATPEPLNPDDSFYHRLFEVMRSDMNMYDPRMTELETSAFQDGPFIHAMVMRITLYLSSLIFIALATAPQIVACFCFGAALLKLGYFHGQRRSLRTLFIVVGLGVAMPLNIVGHLLTPDSATSYAAGAGAMFCMALGGPLTALMYLTLIMIVVERAALPRVTSVLAPLGRMGLTGYLGESLLMSFVMLHWGLALFGQTTW